MFYRLLRCGWFEDGQGVLMKMTGDEDQQVGGGQILDGLYTIQRTLVVI